MELMDAIRGRRSIRRYRPDPVSDDDLGYILEAARWAPSWANTQCWEFIIVRDPALKHQLAETLPERNPARQAFGQAPVIVAACGRRGRAGFFKGTAATDKGDWMMFDLGLALQNLTLAAFERGLGTVHVGFFDSRKAEKILQVPPEVALVELLPLGYPDGAAAATQRTAVTEFVFHDRYGNR